MKDLTLRQREVLDFIVCYIEKFSYPPSIREVAENFGMSVKGAHDHILALERKQYLRRDEKKSRCMELLNIHEDDGAQEEAEFIEVPVVGQVAAGRPIFAEENVEGTFAVHKSLLKKNKTYFAVKVRGDSMSEAGILNGDTAIIEKTESAENGEIVVAFIESDDSVT